MKIGIGITLLYLLYDDSGSMYDHPQPINILNKLIEQWRDKPALVTLAHYGHNERKALWSRDYTLQPAQTAPLLTAYQPHTAFEAPAEAINDIIDEITGNLLQYPVTNIIFAIFCDGDDNSSNGQERSTAQTKVSECLKLGWKMLLVLPPDIEFQKKDIRYYGFTQDNVLQL